MYFLFVFGNVIKFKHYHLNFFLSRGHSTADYATLNGRLFTEKTFLMLQWPSLTRIMLQIRSA